ncbi:uncharacterized protein DUF58 [Comamonas sp. BIGb0124]|nr:uncharacterized protein DUF58 [Comamonas sp. BIGb0124]
MMKKSQPDPAAAPATGGPPVADATLRRLEWKVLRRLDGLLQGDHRTLMRGGGMDLSDLRSYQFSDDVRQIDWNVTARLQEPHVRIYTEDREMTAWFLIDLSASMDFGSSRQRKRDTAEQFATVLSRLLTRSGNRVGAMIHGTDSDTTVPPGQGRPHVLRLLHTLQTRRSANQRAGGATQLEDLLRRAAGVVRKRSTIFILSDFFSPEGWDRPLAQLAQRHDVLAVRLLDPLEIELPDLGLLPIRDAETGEQMLVDTHDPAFRRRFASIAAQREADLRAAFQKAGVDTMELSTEDDLVDALMRLSDMRNRRGRTHAPSGLPGHLHHPPGRHLGAA